MQREDTTNFSQKTTHAAGESETDFSSEIAQLRADLKALKDDLTSITTAATKEAKATLKDKISSAEERVSDAVDVGATEMKEIQRQTELAVKKNPLTAMAAALAIGYFIAGVTRK